MSSSVHAERGKFLAIDLAGLTFRVLIINLSKKQFDLRAKLYTIPPALLIASGEQFFDFLAQCLFSFTSENGVQKQRLPLGLSFGFPLEQRGLSVGILKFWTKGFNCSGVAGKNVVELLEAAIKRKEGLLVNVVAVLNDTTGTLMSCAWRDPRCKIGLIVDAGTNCCYVEQSQRIKKFPTQYQNKPFVIINTESGAFGDGGQIEFLRTQWDRELDADTLNPGINLCEKMISSLYLGELVRRVLHTAADRGLIFSGVVSERLASSGSFDTKFISDVARDLPGQYRTSRAVLIDMGYPMPWAQDCHDLQYTCHMAWTRAGHIMAAEMAAILNYMGLPDVTIGVDGNLYRSHPGLANLLTFKIRELTRSDIKFRVTMSEDGGGLGAALIAATAKTATSRVSRISASTSASVSAQIAEDEEELKSRSSAITSKRKKASHR